MIFLNRLVLILLFFLLNFVLRVLLKTVFTVWLCFLKDCVDMIMISNFCDMVFSVSVVNWSL